METCKISSLYNLSETLAAELFLGGTAENQRVYLQAG